jgi:hypothetical protein
MKKSKTSKPAKQKEPKRPEPHLDPEVQAEFKTFCEFVPSKRFARYLRSWLLEFLVYDGSVEAPYLQDLIMDLDSLFDLLDKIEKAQGGIEERE